MRTRHPRPPLAALLVLASLATTASLACGGASSGPAWELGECDGVPCVISHRPVWADAEAWTVDPVARLVISGIGADSELLFSDVVSALTLGDGALGVADARSSQISIFAADGQLLRVFGGRGEGPNEFRRILWFAKCAPDVFHVLDLARRLATLDPGGEVLGTTDIGASLEQAAQRRVCDTTGAMAGLANAGGAPISAEPRLVRRQGVAKVAVRGEPVRVLGEFPITESLIGLGDGRRHLLGKSTSLALAGGVVYVGTADRFEMDVFTTDGELVRRQSRPYRDLALTSAHLDALVEHELPLLSDREQELQLAHIRAGNNPESLPAYDDLHIDPEAALWAHHFRLPGESANTWSVFDAAGVWLGEVEMPPRFRATEIGDDFVLGVQLDALDEQSVAIYPLLRGR